MYVHVSPPSPERQIPSPTDTELRVQLSPVPTQTTFGSEGSSAIAPMDWTGCLSKTGLNVVPPSSDFHTPPEAEPTNRVILPSGSARPATAAMRPLIAAEPMLRAPRPEIAPVSSPGGARGRDGCQRRRDEKRGGGSHRPRSRRRSGLRRERERLRRDDHVRLGLLVDRFRSRGERGVPRPALLAHRDVDTADLLVVAVVRLDLLLGPADRERLQVANDHPRIGVDPHRHLASPLQPYAQLVRERAVHVLGPEVFERMALGLRVHERPVEVRREPERPSRRPRT